MKTKSIIMLAASAAFLTLLSCKPEAPDTGKEPDQPAGQGYIPGTLVAEDNRTEVTLREGTGETKTLGFRYVTDKELAEARTVTLAVDEASTLPKENYEVPATLTVAEGSDRSEMQTLTFKATGLETGEYTLVLKEVVEDAQDDVKASEPLEFKVTVRTPQEGAYGFHPDYKMVGYLNTEDYQPLLADIYLLERYQRRVESVYYYLYEIINLRKTVLKENNGRAELVLGRDMEHVLANRAKYIVPLQDKGRKVCLTLEGGGTGLGFCNLTDEQTDDFVAQVRKVVYDNDLDGVNFFDKGAAYDQAEANGFPAMNTTSYPKLIQKMRAALPGKLVTLADYGEPTAYFYDTEATGGIKVGEHVDYAWSGYMERDEPLQILDPWGLVDPNDPKVSEANEFTDEQARFPFSQIERKPIAGLTQDRYCNFACPYYSNQSQYEYRVEISNLATFAYCGWYKGKVFVCGDIISNHQNEYEQAWEYISFLISNGLPTKYNGQEAFYYNVKQNNLLEYTGEEWNTMWGFYDWFAKDWE